MLRDPIKAMAGKKLTNGGARPGAGRKPAQVKLKSFTVAVSVAASAEVEKLGSLRSVGSALVLLGLHKTGRYKLTEAEERQISAYLVMADRILQKEGSP